MAYPFQQPEGLTREQADILRELNSFKSVSESDAWKKIMARLDSNVEEALEAMVGCDKELPLEQRGILQLRWQQREAIRRDLVSFVESQVEERNRLLEEIKEQSDGDTDDHSGDPGSNDQ